MFRGALLFPFFPSAPPPAPPRHGREPVQQGGETLPLGTRWWHGQEQ